jgi:hypothetical protein
VLLRFSFGNENRHGVVVSANGLSPSPFVQLALLGLRVLGSALNRTSLGRKVVRVIKGTLEWVCLTGSEASANHEWS